MKDILQSYRAEIQCICPKLPNEALDYIMEKLTVSELEPKEFYIQAGEVQKQLGYIAEGLLRFYYIDDKANEITIAFQTTGSPVADFFSIDNPQPSRFYVQCLEKTTIINLPYEHLQDCVDRYPAFERFIRIHLERAFSRLYDRMQSFLFLSAEERYLKFIKENPALMQRISVTHLCSFLGIGRQALTKIRKRIIMKK